MPSGSLGCNLLSYISPSAARGILEALRGFSQFLIPTELPDDSGCRGTGLRGKVCLPPASVTSLVAAVHRAMDGTCTNSVFFTQLQIK